MLIEQKVRMLVAIIDLTENGKKTIPVDTLMQHLDKHNTLKMSVDEFEMYRMTVLAKHSLLPKSMVN